MYKEDLPRFTFQDRSNTAHRWVLETILQIGEHAVPLVRDGDGSLGVLSKPLAVACGYVQAAQLTRAILWKRPKDLQRKSLREEFREGIDYRTCCDEALRRFECLAEQYPVLAKIYRRSQSEIVIPVKALPKLDKITKNPFEPILTAISRYEASLSEEPTPVPVPHNIVDLVESISEYVNDIEKRKAEKKVEVLDLDDEIEYTARNLARGLGVPYKPGETKKAAQDLKQEKAIRKKTSEEDLSDLIRENDRPGIFIHPENDKFLGITEFQTNVYACASPHHQDTSLPKMCANFPNLSDLTAPLLRRMGFLDKANNLLGEDAKYFIHVRRSGRKEIITYHEEIVTAVLIQVLKDHAGTKWLETSWRPLQINQPADYNLRGATELAKKLVRKLRERHNIED